MKVVESRDEFLKECWLELPIVNCYCIEIGVFRGDFSKMILDIIEPDELYLIDPFELSKEKYSSGLTTAYSDEEDYQLVLNRFKDEIKERKVIINRGYSFDIVELYSDARFDFIYLDGSHLYKDVKRDLNDWLPKLGIDGLMCGHDYIDDTDFGVKRAVNEFCRENNFEMFLFNQQGGDFALRRK